MACYHWWYWLYSLLEPGSCFGECFHCKNCIPLASAQNCCNLILGTIQPNYVNTDNSLKQPVSVLCLRHLCWNPEGAGSKKAAPGTRYVFSVETHKNGSTVEPTQSVETRLCIAKYIIVYLQKTSRSQEEKQRIKKKTKNKKTMMG